MLEPRSDRVSFSGGILVAKFWELSGEKNSFLVGGFNPFEKYYSKWIISPGRDESKKYLKPPPSFKGGDSLFTKKM